MTAGPPPLDVAMLAPPATASLLEAPPKPLAALAPASDGASPASQGMGGAP